MAGEHFQQRFAYSATTSPPFFIRMTVIPAGRNYRGKDPIGRLLQRCVLIFEKVLESRATRLQHGQPVDS